MSFFTTVLSQSKIATGALPPRAVPVQLLWASMVFCSCSRTSPGHASWASSWRHSAAAPVLVARGVAHDVADMRVATTAAVVANRKYCFLSAPLLWLLSSLTGPDENVDMFPPVLKILNGL